MVDTLFLLLTEVDVLAAVVVRGCGASLLLALQLSELLALDDPVLSLPFVDGFLVLLAQVAMVIHEQQTVKAQSPERLNLNLRFGIFASSWQSFSANYTPAPIDR